MKMNLNWTTNNNAMAARNEVPSEIRELVDVMTSFTYRNGLEARTVFSDLLRYIINGFSLPGSPALSDWRYTEEQTAEFCSMFGAWVGIMDEQLRKRGWYDAFGDLFMALAPHDGQAFRGQFFTPMDIATLCAKLMAPDSEVPHTVCDNAAGSGRMLLAARAGSPKSYFVAQDIDYTCCLMCVCNFLIHGCVGEVICMDSLGMRAFRGAWLVNANLHSTGLPSVIWMNEDEYGRFKGKQYPPELFFMASKEYDEYFLNRNNSNIGESRK